MEGYRLANREVTIAAGVKVDGGVRFPFALDLKGVYPAGGLRPTCIGTHYFLRHEIIATASKTWYSFGGGEVETRLPVHLVGPERIPRNVPEGRTTLKLSEFGDDGCSFTFDKTIHDIAGPGLSGEVTIKGAAGVAFCKLELIKVEFADENSWDTQIWTRVAVPAPADVDAFEWSKNPVRVEKDEELDETREFVDVVEPAEGVIAVSDKTVEVRLAFSHLVEDEKSARRGVRWFAGGPYSVEGGRGDAAGATRIIREGAARGRRM